MPAETPPPIIEEHQANTRNENDGWRRALIVLLFLLFSFLCLLCSSQGALYFVDRERILGDMRSRLQADYGVGPDIELSPLDRDKLLTEIPKDQTDLETSQTPQVVAVVIVPLPHATLVAQVPTVVPPIPTLSPTPTATPTPTPIPGSGSTPGATPTGQQTLVPTSSPAPITPVPTTAVPTTAVPTTAVPTIAVPTTVVPTTAVPTTAVPTTAAPTAAVPTTAVPTTAVPTTAIPTTAVPTTAIPTTAIPTPTFTPTPIPTTPIPTNSPPSPANDGFTIPEDSGPTPINVLANDTDPDNDIDPTSVAIISGPANGTATVNPVTGVIVYTPNPNFFGTELIIYQVCDGNGSCATATLTITVTPVSDPPIALNDLAITDEEVPTTTIVLANDSDPDGDPLSVISVTQPPNGTVVINPDDTVTYTPTLNFFGTDVFTYTISDGSLTDSASVTVTVNPIPDPPVAVDDLADTAEDSQEDILVLVNDFDVDNDPLTVILVGTPMSGTVTHNGTLVTYTPLPDVSGTDIFTYTITDGLFTDTATVTMTIIPINDPPIAFNDAYTMSLSGGPLVVPAPGVLGNDTDVDSTVLTATLVTPPISGALLLNPDGSFSYTAVLTGTYSFTYQAEDNISASNVATVVITVFP